MRKRLVEIDDILLDAARMQLGTGTVKATIEEALRRVSGSRHDSVPSALEVLAQAAPTDRSAAWR
jgi:hypothetical protein